MPTRTPRTIALEKGTDASRFEGDGGYCAECGHPHGPGLPACGKGVDYAANPVNPPEKPVPATGLKR